MASADHSTPMARLEARVSPETKALLQKAADLEGCGLLEHHALLREEGFF
jgi:uncharacterized protein (DUF1778 family)